MKKRAKFNQSSSEQSFTLVETMLAAFLMATIIMQVGSVQGGAVYFLEYGRNVTQASWLAKGVMAKVEYYSQVKPFEELNVSEKNLSFKDKMFEDYKLDITIEEFNMPIVEIISAALNPPNPEADEDSEPPKPDEALVGMVKQVLGEEVIKIANVRVSWPEGAKRNYTDLSYVIPNSKKLDEVIGSLGPLTQEKPTSTPTANPAKPPAQAPAQAPRDQTGGSK